MFLIYDFMKSRAERIVEILVVQMVIYAVFMEREENE